MKKYIAMMVMVAVMASLAGCGQQSSDLSQAENGTYLTESASEYHIW
ncbi:MAG: hypothetical protein PHP50_13030 [Lachnospiraceae bacterium]|nr:hypothetical protein [Lachnospiraceae bacterium]